MKIHLINKKGDIIKTDNDEDELGPYEIWWKRFAFKNSRNDTMNRGFHHNSLWSRFLICFG